jgi:hypothetical protein
MKDKFPLNIMNEKQKNRFVAATSINNLYNKSPNIRQELAYLENDYSFLIKSIRDTMSQSLQTKKSDPRLYWLVGDSIVRFLERIEDIGFYLLNQNKTLSRDIGISENSIKKIISFRKRFIKLSTVNPTIPWVKYRDNKVPVHR